MAYSIIYDGRCNLCVSLVQMLEHLDRGQLFHYVPMQDQATLSQWQITPQECEAGMILIQNQAPQHRWQGSAAAEEIARLFPGGAAIIAAYRGLPGLQWTGDRCYEQLRDNRYALFGERSELYTSAFPVNPPDCAECQDRSFNPR